MEENSAFRKYLEQCTSFTNGCPFKELDVLTPIKTLIANGQLSHEYAEQVLEKHKELSDVDWSRLSETCPAFQNGCIFSKAVLPEGSSLDLPAQCPVWKNGCPFHLMLSDGKQSLVESLQSNSWDILLLSGAALDQTDAALMPTGLLATMLKEGTQQSHSLAESVQFVKRFRKKQITKELYQLLLRDLYFVYANMELIFDDLRQTNENLRALDFPQLRRTVSLQEDLKFFFGAEEAATIFEDARDDQRIKELSPATANYVARLRYCARQKRAGELLIAHAYTRYLGDLSGGQLLKRMTRRSLALPPGPRNATTAQIRELPAEEVDGTRFYDFMEIDDNVEFKKKYRECLDSLKISAKTADSMVEEANVAFRLNMELFQELDATAGFTKENEDEKEEEIPAVHPPIQNADGNAKCPFQAMLGGPNSAPASTRSLSQSHDSKVPTPSPVSLRNSSNGSRSIVKEGADSEAAAPSFLVAGVIAAFCFVLSFFIVQYSGASYL